MTGSDAASIGVNMMGAFVVDNTVARDTVFGMVVIGDAVVGAVV